MEKRSKFALFKAMAAAARRGRLTGVDLSLESHLLYDVAQSKLQQGHWGDMGVGRKAVTGEKGVNFGGAKLI